MRFSSKTGIFPWFTISEGFIGFLLQCWLFSDMDGNGLLPQYHFAGIMSLLLLAITLVICWMGARVEADTRADDLFPFNPPAAVGIAVSAVGFGVSAFTASGFSLLQFLTPVFGILAAAALMYVAYCRLKGLQANCLLYCIITVYLILRTMSRCHTWGAEPQLLQHFFPLLSCIFLLLTSYYRAALAIGEGDYRRYVFFNQAALFCCCLSCRGSDWLFYLSAAIWLSWDSPFPSAAHTGRYLR